jgi:PAS domain S-box-containing protein
MKNNRKLSTSELRHLAEAKFSEQAEKFQSLTNADALRLIHELEVHQIELEMQNEELVRARAEAEEAYRQYTDLYDFAPIGYLTFGHDGTIHQANLPGATMLGVERVKLLNRRLGLFISEESHPVLSAFLDELLSGEGKKRCELLIENKERGLLWARLEATCFEGGTESRAVILDITERKRAVELIRQYATELEKRVDERTTELVRANRAKDEFLANMSHELRTPLSSILATSELLLEGVRGPMNERQEQAVQIIQSSGDHLLGLINDILDIARIEAGKFELHPENVEVNEICQSSLVFIKQLADKKSIEVKYSASPTSLTVFADPKRLKQILVNLLNNAAKFTPEKGTITLKVQADAKAGLMHFSITDTGIGIKPEDLPKLFKPFEQLDASLSRQYEGSGLGLSLVKRLIDIHKGHIKIQSEVGKGSCFTFDLPWEKRQ